MAGGTPTFCPLRPNGKGDNASKVFTLDLAELEASITPRTKVLLLNTPHNPTGKMFSLQELQGIAEIVQRHPQLTVISDEVYEHLVFDEQPHISMASTPGMFDRTLTLSSSGKTFSCTGWKVGWAVGPARLVKAVTATQQWVNFSAPTPNQDAMAQALQIARDPYQGFDTYYDWLANDYKRKRGLLVDALTAAGMTAILPPGGFFIMADTSHIDLPSSFLEEVTDAMPASPMPRDWAMSRWLTKEVGVTAIPPSAFYSAENLHLAKNLLRFAFCKGDDTIREAHKRLDTYFN
jgi:aspartate/methionine/tyrosine aminotransferase